MTDTTIEGHTGYLMTAEDFIKNCLCQGFIDYDGYGNWTDGEKIFGEVKPSDVVGYDEMTEEAFTRHSWKPPHKFVLWYNR